MKMPELIDREVTQLLLDTAIKQFSENWLQDKLTKNGLLIAKRIVSKQPTIEAEPVRHGRWIPTEYDSYADGAPVWDKWECSECGHERSGEEDTLTAFCPDCGAKMDATDTNVGGKGGADNG